MRRPTEVNRIAATPRSDGTQGSAIGWGETPFGIAYLCETFDAKCGCEFQASLFADDMTWQFALSAVCAAHARVS